MMKSKMWWENAIGRFCRLNNRLPSGLLSFLDGIDSWCDSIVKCVSVDDWELGSSQGALGCFEVQKAASGIRPWQRVPLTRTKMWGLLNLDSLSPGGGWLLTTGFWMVLIRYWICAYFSEWRWRYSVQVVEQQGAAGITSLVPVEILHRHRAQMTPGSPLM